MWRNKLVPLAAAMLLFAPHLHSAPVADPLVSVFVWGHGSPALSVPSASVDCLGPARPLLADHRITEGMELNLEHPVEFSLEVDLELSLITLHGTLQIGVATALGNALNAHPCVTGILLDSDGGNVYQARALASLVLTHELDTIVRHRCHSACALVFVAGDRRFLAEGASIGFHCYRFKSSVVTRPGIDPLAEQEKDFRFFAERIPDADFARTIFRCQSPGLWLPTPAQLLQAGVVHEILTD